MQTIGVFYSRVVHSRDFSAPSHTLNVVRGARGHRPIHCLSDRIGAEGWARGQQPPAPLPLWLHTWLFVFPP